VAIVQISRITQRKGLTSDLPQPLAGAELGWATDERRLFIGNGTLDDGAPVVGNTEILTEFSDLLAFTTGYTYQGAAAGYTVQTGATAGTPISQSIQSRLDSYAVVTDFGATGDGVTDDTAAINRALFQLYCREINPQVRRSLFFPAGNYLITGTINVPPYAMLYGEGPESSIFNFYIGTWTSTASYQAGVLVKNSSSYYRSNTVVPVGTLITNTTYWTAETLPSYIVRTADSLQQTGANIATNGAIAPQSIEMSGIKMVTNLNINGLLIEDAVNCSFTDLDIQGTLTTSNTSTDFTTANNKAIDFASTTSLVCKHIKIDNCVASGFTWGINTAQQLKSVTVSNCYFNSLYQGVYLGGATPVNGGATGVRLIGNIFDSIYVEGIVINGVSLNASAYNIFYDVGNHFNGAALPASSIIDINIADNVSIGDMFQRTTAYSGTYPRINLNNTASIGLDNAVQLQLGTYVRQTGLSATLVNNVGNTALFTTSSASTKAFNFDYTVVRNGTDVRTGVFTVVASTDGTGSNLVYNDSGFQNVSTGITFAAAETAGTVTVYYSSTNTGYTASLHYSVTKLA
jgi:hypothetical protein